MMSSHKLETALAVVPEMEEWSLPAETVDLIGQVVTAKAMRYRSELHMADFTKSVGLARGIVEKALVEGARIRGVIPQTKGKISEDIKNGLAIRQGIQKETAEIFREFANAPQTRSDLGWEREDVVNVESEHRNQARVLWPEKSAGFNEQVRNRREIMTVVANGILRREFIDNQSTDTRFDLDAIERLLPDDHTKTLVMREAILSVLGEMVGVEINPLFLTLEKIELLSDQFEKLAEISRRTSGQLTEGLMAYFEVPPPLQAESAVFIDTLIHQTVRVFEKWQQIKTDQQLSQDDTQYWHKLSTLFSEWLPMSPITADQDFVVSGEQLPAALQANRPHIWQDAVVIEGMAIPSLKDIFRAMQIVSLDRGNAGSLGIRLLAAEQAWKNYQRIVNKYPTEIKELHNRIRVMENGALDESLVDVLDLTSRLPVLARDEAKTWRALLYHRKMMTQYDDLLETLADSSWEKQKTGIWLKQLSIKLQSLEQKELRDGRSIGERARAASRGFGWWNFSPDGNWLTISLSGQEDIEAELESSRRSLAQAKQAPDLLPLIVRDNFDKLPKFFEDWKHTLDEEMMAPHKQPQKVKKLKEINEGLFYLSHGIPYDFGAWYCRDMEAWRESLRLQLKARANLATLKQDVTDLKTLIRSGRDDGALASRLRQELDLPRRNTIGEYLTLRVIPDRVKDSVSDYWMDGETAEALDRLVLASRAVKGLAFPMPHKNDLDTTLQQLRVLPRVHNNQDAREMVDLLDRLRDHPIMPWEYTGTISRSAFIHALEYRINVVKALIALPYLEAEHIRKSARTAEVRQKLAGVQTSIDMKKLVAMHESKSEEFDAAEDELIQAMNQIGLAVEKWILRGTGL